MSSKNKELLFFKRLLIWILYLSAGFILYSKNGNLFSYLITFARIIFPLSIFWLQIRIKNRGNFLSIDSSMSTSELWYTILPVLASFSTIVITFLNAFLYFLEQLTSF